MQEKLRREIRNSKIIRKEDKIVIGISGGPDSVALFYLLTEIKKEKNIELYLAHVNHLLRGKNASEDEKFVKSLGDRFDIPVYIKREDIKVYSDNNKIGIEEAGREIRYSFFEEVKNKVGANKVALAHNLDDDIETFLFRLMRGTSLSGLTSIPKQRDFYIRPLLGIRKKEILDYLEENNLKYRIDESNKTLDYTRNKIRLDLIPKIENEYNNRFKEKVTKLIDEINQVDDYFEDKIKKFKTDKVVIKELEKLPAFLQKRVINNMLGYKVEITNEKIENILELIKKGGTVSIDVGNGYKIKKGYKIIEIIKSKSKRKSTSDFKKVIKVTPFLEEEVKYLNYKISLEIVNSVEREKNSFYFDYDKLKSNNIIIRTRRAGDKFKPLGMKGKTKKVKDLFINKKIKKGRRDSIPIIIDKSNNQDNIVYILGLRGSENYKVDSSTKKIIKISFEEGI